MKEPTTKLVCSLQSGRVHAKPKTVIRLLIQVLLLRLIYPLLVKPLAICLLLGFVLKIREEFWGTDGVKKAPSTSQRSEKLREMYTKFKMPGTEGFNFFITDGVTDAKVASVCEAAYAHFLGFTNVTNQWKTIRQEVLNPGLRKLPRDHTNPRATLTTHATAYITAFAKANCDLVATASAEDKPFYVLPYGSVNSFWTEYKTDCENKAESFALLSTFTLALNNVNKTDDIM